MDETTQILVDLVARVEALEKNLPTLAQSIAKGLVAGAESRIAALEAKFRAPAAPASEPGA